MNQKHAEDIHTGTSHAHSPTNTHLSTAGMVMISCPTSLFGLFDQKHNMLLLSSPFVFFRLIENRHGHFAVKKVSGDRLDDTCSKVEKGANRDRVVIEVKWPVARYMFLHFDECKYAQVLFRHSQK